MSMHNRISSMRNASVGGTAPTGQSPALIARINDKRAELENLKQLKELSANLAQQMQMLEDKLSTLSDGTEAIAAVLSNWHNVLQAINLASVKVASTAQDLDSQTGEPKAPLLPETLVRIPANELNKR